MWFKHSMSITQQLIPIYNTTDRTKSDVALNVAKLFMPKVLKTLTGHKGGGATWSRKAKDRQKRRDLAEGYFQQWREVA